MRLNTIKLKLFSGLGFDFTQTQASKLVGTISWVLKEDMKLLGQRQKTVIIYSTEVA